ncbi:MAG: HEAT repeat domain-containing protein [bacterium]
MNFLGKFFGKNKDSDNSSIKKSENPASTEEITSEPDTNDKIDPIESFITRLKSDPTLFPFDIVMALAEIDNDHAMEALSTALNNDNIKIRKTAIKAVESIANSRFLASLEPDSKDWQKDPAIQASVDIGDDHVVKILISSLNDEKIDEPTRKSAINTLGILGQNGDKRTVEPIIKALNDKAWSVRFQAADSLVKIYKEGKLEETDSNLVEAKIAAIKSILPSERIQDLRKNGLWPF